MNSSQPAYAKDFLNKVFPAGTKQLDLPTLPDGTKQDFGEQALYFLETQYYKRWGRKHRVSDGLIPQREVIVVDKDGSINPLSPVQFPWAGIYTIDKYHVDQDQLTIKGGEFTTINNLISAETYVHRGIHIQRSNVLVQGVKHYLAGEEKQFTNDSFYQKTTEKDGVTVVTEEGYHARLGAPYQGFFRISYCMNVTLKDCVMTNHLRVFCIAPGNDTDSTAPYDFYAEFAVNVTLDHCTSAKNTLYTREYVEGILGIGDKVPATYDDTGIMDQMRWGVTGTNYIKNLNLVNESSINRIDAHKGTYNLTVKDSTLGYLGIVAVGFGDMVIERSTVNSDFFVSLRRDFGSAWMGDVYINDCTWVLHNDCYAQRSPRLFFASYIPTYMYGYEPIVENGVTYYSSLPRNIYIDGLTIDASDITVNTINTNGIQIYSAPLSSGTTVINDAYFANSELYTYPLKSTEHIYLKNLTVIKNKKMGSSPLNVNIQNVNTTTHSEYFFEYSNTQLHYKPENQTVIVAD